MQNDAEQPQPSQTPGNLANGRRIIQPINDMSAYANQGAAVPPQPQAAPVPPPSPASAVPGVEQQLVPPAAPAPVAMQPPSIYPSAQAGIGASPQLPPQAVPSAVPGTTGPAQPNVSQSVSVAVPILMVYAIFSIIYSTYAIISTIPRFTQPVVVVTSAGGAFHTEDRLRLSVWAISAVLVALANIAIAVYCLLSKNIRVVVSLLTALLILAGIGLVERIATFIRLASRPEVGFHFTFTSIIPWLIIVGLFMFLWHVKSTVELYELDHPEKESA